MATLAAAAGSVTCSNLLAARVYEAAIPPGGGTTCFGPACFRATMLALAGLCGLGAAAAAWLSRRLAAGARTQSRALSAAAASRVAVAVRG